MARPVGRPNKSETGVAWVPLAVTKAAATPTVRELSLDAKVHGHGRRADVVLTERHARPGVTELPCSGSNLRHTRPLPPDL